MENAKKRSFPMNGYERNGAQNEESTGTCDTRNKESGQATYAAIIFRTEEFVTSRT